jgi:hypothetical protein
MEVLMCFIFHDWSKWEQYEEHGKAILERIAPKSVQGKEVSYTEIRQKRYCKKCNKMQDELVNDSI